MVALLVPKVDASLVEGLIPIPLERVGTLSLYFFPSVGQHMMSTMESNLMARQRSQT